MFLLTISLENGVSNWVSELEEAEMQMFGAKRHMDKCYMGGDERRDQINRTEMTRIRWQTWCLYRSFASKTSTNSTFTNLHCSKSDPIEYM